ncbi:MAG: type II secretion system F family protein [Acetobacteraceae bacterium]
MSRILLLTLTGIGALVLILAAVVLLRLIQRQTRLAARVQTSRGLAPVVTATRQEAAHHAWTRVVALLGQAVLRTGLLSARTRAGLQLTLMTAGLRGRNGLELFIGGKIALLLILPMIAIAALREVTLPTILHIVIPAAAATLGLLLPDMVVRFRRKRYIARVKLGLPDAFDLLVICTQAGLGLTAAITRVAREMQHGYRDVGLELALTANDLQLMADSRLALQNMGQRTGIDGLVRLGTTLLQSMQFGTPLTDSIRMLAAEMRADALTRLEGRAARMGVLLTLPMVVFILPCVFLVVAGPAMVQVLHIGGP